MDFALQILTEGIYIRIHCKQVDMSGPPIYWPFLPNIFSQKNCHFIMHFWVWFSRINSYVMVSNSNYQFDLINSSNISLNNVGKIFWAFEHNQSSYSNQENDEGIWSMPNSHTLQQSVLVEMLQWRHSKDFFSRWRQFCFSWFIMRPWKEPNFTEL